MALDIQDQTVELQHFDGTLEELDFDVWQATDMERAQAPEDWSGSVDVSYEDIPERESNVHQNWQQAMDLINRFE